MISLPSMISSFYTSVKEDLQGNTKVERLVLCKLFHCYFGIHEGLYLVA